MILLQHPLILLLVRLPAQSRGLSPLLLPHLQRLRLREKSHQVLPLQTLQPLRLDNEARSPGDTNPLVVNRETLV